MFAADRVPVFMEPFRIAHSLLVSLAPIELFVPCGNLHPAGQIVPLVVELTLPGFPALELPLDSPPLPPALPITPVVV